MFVALVSYSDSDWAGDPSSRDVTEQWARGTLTDDPLVSFSGRQSCVATSSGMAEYHAMCSLVGERATVTDSSSFDSRETRPYFVIQMEARGIAQRAGLGKSRLGGEDATAARNCSRPWAADQGGILEGVQSGFEDEILPVTRLNAGRAVCGIVVPGEPTCETIDEGGTDGIGDCLTYSLGLGSSG